MSKSERLAWPILLLLLTVLVPSAGVVWMMREAVRNERLASNQRLREAYRVQLKIASQSVKDRWKEHLGTDRVDANSPAQWFAEIVTRSDLDSVLITDGHDNILYPDTPRAAPRSFDSIQPHWLEAEKLEFTNRQFVKAAETYAEVADQTDDDVLIARSRQAQARCLLAASETSAAIAVLQTQRIRSKLCDDDGRCFAAAAELRLLELLDPNSPDWFEVQRSLHQCLGDYNEVTMTSAHRRFLMSQFPASTDRAKNWPTYQAEILAAQAAATEGITQVDSRLQPTSLADVWARTSASGQLIELYQTETLRRSLLQSAAGSPLPSGVTFVAAAPLEVSDHLVETSLGEALGRWRLGLSMTDGDLFDDVSKQRRAVHLWIGVLVLAVTCVLAWLLASTFHQRLRLAQLKNDLVATVSHELKTPLASTRLLVDTLLGADAAGKPADANQTREYLQLISHENARLTRLIDNFLTFSRMDQRKAALNFGTVDVRDLVSQAITVFREHTGIDDESLQVGEVPELSISGDLDSLVTAMVNLLENAWKYSESPRRIEMHTEADQKQVRIMVQDNGIGMNPREVDRAFDRFYQADQRVSRTHGGCGLGLSIVKAIAQSHDASIEVESEPGVGSRFTLCLPKINPNLSVESV